MDNPKKPFLNFLLSKHQTREVTGTGFTCLWCNAWGWTQTFILRSRYMYSTTDLSRRKCKNLIRIKKVNFIYLVSQWHTIYCWISRRTWRLRWRWGINSWCGCWSSRWTEIISSFSFLSCHSWRNCRSSLRTKQKW